MKTLSTEALSAEFKAQVEARRTEWADYGLNETLRAISTSVDSMRKQGIPVGDVKVIEQPSELAFSLFNAKNALIVPISGTIEVGQAERLFAVATSIGKQDCLKLALSMFDIGHHGATATQAKDSTIIKASVRSKIYDLKDPDGFSDFEKDIIRSAARAAVIAENDTQQAFAGSRKSLPKLSLKQP